MQQPIDSSFYVLNIGDPFFCTFIHGATDKSKRLTLFSQLEDIFKKIDQPWAVLGDFNSLANLNERIGQPVCLQKVVPLRSCLHVYGLKNMKFLGRFFTWNNKQCGDKLVFSKIERILCNERWEDCYPRAKALFLPKRTFDHSPMLIQFFNSMKNPTRFKIFNFWALHENFINIVRQHWSCKVDGTISFQIYSKLITLRRILKAEFHRGPLKSIMDGAEGALHQAQAVLHANPTNPHFAHAKVEAAARFKQVIFLIFSRFPNFN